MSMMASTHTESLHPLAAGNTACNADLSPGISSGMFVMYLSEPLRTSLSAAKFAGDQHVCMVIRRHSSLATFTGHSPATHTHLVHTVLTLCVPRVTGPPSFMQSQICCRVSDGHWQTVAACRAGSSTACCARLPMLPARTQLGWAEQLQLTISAQHQMLAGRQLCICSSSTQVQ